MSYRLDTGMWGQEGAGRYAREATIVLVGCGGTGGFLAEAVCRLLIGREVELYLVDPDTVEPHNVARQAFDRGDVGRFKARVLAERLSRRFGREVGYSVAAYRPELHNAVFDAHKRGLSRLSLLVGCVDNTGARRELAGSLGGGRGGYGRPAGSAYIWWLDTGNGRNSGQVLLGNATSAGDLRGAFDTEASVCRALPAPSLQRPDLLEAPAEPESRPLTDCAEAVRAGEQGPTVNQTMAALAVSYVEQLLAGTCSWMASYVDMDAGTLRSVEAEPGAVAQLTGMAPEVLCSAQGLRWG